ncbi:hypothetical protein AGR4C_pb30053 [Agrobacterium tumefaciens str. Kerr 14]|uniref:RNA polymerase alpha subunit C-terminal domain-containing protein n=1 Tax=Agrobacterium tumefaciens str. Kerr 14 TaxID=1183424 RepID=A0A1S7SES7_AGRTU|nr:hypothetical protein AGR4C_pb30053 [Agrobacterium tumefaciens str. Kerr 14]
MPAPSSHERVGGKKCGRFRGAELSAVIFVFRSANDDEAQMPKQRFLLEKKVATRPTDLVLRSSLPQWVVRVLRQSGIKRMSVIAALSDEQLLQVPGIGRQSLKLIRDEIRRITDLKKRGSTQH